MLDIATAADVPAGQAGYLKRERRGLRAWSVLALGQGEVTTPSWREVWGWLLISFGVLVGGMLVNGLLSQEDWYE